MVIENHELLDALKASIMKNNKKTGNHSSLEENR